MSSLLTDKEQLLKDLSAQLPKLQEHLYLRFKALDVQRETRAKHLFRAKRLNLESLRLHITN